MNSPDFTISAIGAPLVEVIGDGPYTDRAGGLSVPDGVPTSSTVDLLNEWVRRWRVDAPPTTQVAVALLDSPYGALVDVRRCEVVMPVRWWQRIIEVRRWPWFRAFATERAAVARPVTNDAAACVWRGVSSRNWESVNARGGDVVVVTFVEP